MNEKKVAIYSMNWTNCYKWEYSKNKIIIIDIDTIIPLCLLYSYFAGITAAFALLIEPF